jgi:drug/metabolite transporter (DMT)-like permease
MPIFGKQAISAGFPPLAVVAVRTAGSAVLLMGVLLIFRRRYLYIYPVGLLGCLLAGGLNGAGSLLYYTALAHLDAGLAQLLFSVYPVIVGLVLYFDGQRQAPATVVGLLVSLPAVYLLTRSNASGASSLAALAMLGAALLFALHIPINQRILYEAPAQSVTAYTLLAMTAIVVPASLALTPPLQSIPSQAMAPLAALTAATFFSRLALFSGVKRVGGMQTSLLGLAELLVALTLASCWLHERLTAHQWIGAALLVLALVVAGKAPPAPRPRRGQGWLHWLTPPTPLAPLEPGDERRAGH